jgi:hypothetical protein
MASACAQKAKHALTRYRVGPRKQVTDMRAICVVATVMQLQLKFWAAKWITADKTFNLSRAACTV